MTDQSLSLQTSSRLLNKRGKSPCREFAPVLQPSSSSSSCSSCHVEWSLVVRRHHCKRCGRLTCSQCSSKRVVLPSRNNKPLRVCLSCYTVLRDIKGHTDTSPYSSLISFRKNKTENGKDALNINRREGD